MEDLNGWLRLLDFILKAVGSRGVFVEQSVFGRGMPGESTITGPGQLYSFKVR